MRARFPHSDHQTGEQIADELGWLPLALEQAAAWLDRTQMPGEEYLELLRSRREPSCTPAARSAAWPARSPRCGIRRGPHHRREPGRGPTARRLRVPGPRTGPAGFVHRPCGPAARAAGVGRRDRLAFTDAIAVLVDYSLGQADPGRAAAAPARAGHHPRPRQQPRTPVRKRATRCSPPMARQRARADGGSAGGGVAVATRRCTRYGSGAPQDWPRWAVLLPHVLAATGHAGHAERSRARR